MSEPAPEALSKPRPDSKGAARGLYARLIGLCAGPRAMSAFGVLSALESAVLPIPIDAVMIPLLLAQMRKLWTIVLIGTIGSVVGAALGYLIGAVFYETAGRAIIDFYGLSAEFENFRVTYANNGVLAVIVAGITPIPFKLAAILGGVAAMRFDVFLITAFGIRLLRFALVALAVRLVGPSVQTVLERHGGKSMLAIIAVMVLGFLALPLLQ